MKKRDFFKAIKNSCNFTDVRDYGRGVSLIPDTRVDMIICIDFTTETPCVAMKIIDPENECFALLTHRDYKALYDCMEEVNTLLMSNNNIAQVGE